MMSKSQNRTVDKHIIWSDMNLNPDDWRDSYKDFLEINEIDGNPNDEHGLYEYMVETNGEYLSDERENLNVQLAQPIIVIGDIGRWLDRHMEKASRGIRFITPDYKEKFKIPDGDKIRITLSDGEQLDRTCRYIDDYHLEVGSNLYHICEFAERMEQNGNTVIPLRSSLPEQCYVFVQTENCVGIVKKGESGFYRTDIQGGKPSETNALVNEMNKKLGLSKGQAEAMKAGSMFGWNTPAADPKSYDKNGIPVRPKQKDYER